jgi:hypothetical protein
VEIRVGEDVGDFAELRRDDERVGIALAVVVVAAVAVLSAIAVADGRAAAAAVVSDV